MANDKLQRAKDQRNDEFYTQYFDIEAEINNYGFYLSYHPVTKIDRTNLITLNDYKNYFDKTISIVLFLENIKNIKTKNGDAMSFVTLSDEYGKVEGVIFPKSLNNIEVLEKNNVYKINARVKKRDNSYQLIILNMILLPI